MIAYICDSCGRELRGHPINDMRISPRPLGWWTRYSMTTIRQELQLFACSEECCAALDQRWPPLDRFWHVLDAMTAKEERSFPVDVVHAPPNLPDPPRDKKPRTPALPEPAKGRSHK